MLTRPGHRMATRTDMMVDDSLRGRVASNSGGLRILTRLDGQPARPGGPSRGPDTLDGRSRGAGPP